MRDDRDRWPAAITDVERRLDGEGIAVRRVAPKWQVLISGNRDAALRLAGLSHAVAWPDMAPEGAYAVSLRRDRILAVNVRLSNRGWLASEGLAVTDMGCGYEVVEVAGPGAMDLLKTGTELSLAEPSASALRLWHGHDVILYRHGDETTFRMQIGAAFAEALWGMFERQIALAQGGNSRP